MPTVKCNDKIVSHKGKRHLQYFILQLIPSTTRGPCDPAAASWREWWKWLLQTCCSSRKETAPYEAGSLEDSTCSESVSSTWCYFFTSENSWIQESWVEMEDGLLTVTPSDMFASYPCDLMFFWPGGLSPKGRNASTRRHNINSIGLDIETATQPSGLLMSLSQ